MREFCGLDLLACLTGASGGAMVLSAKSGSMGCKIVELPASRCKAV